MHLMVLSGCETVQVFKLFVYICIVVGDQIIRGGHFLLIALACNSYVPVQNRTWIFNVLLHGTFEFNCLRREVVVCFLFC